MKLVKRIPFQMFIRNLSAALVCIYGMLIMQYNLIIMSIILKKA